MRLIKIDILLTKPKRIPGPFISRHCQFLRLDVKAIDDLLNVSHLFTIMTQMKMFSFQGRIMINYTSYD